MEICTKFWNIMHNTLRIMHAVFAKYARIMHAVYSFIYYIAGT